MKQDVVKFLANLPKNDSEKFNKAVSLYRQSKGNDPSLVRFMNSMGFSNDRLENVLYELKKLHSVSDLEVANAKMSERVKSEERKDIRDIEVNDAEDASTPLSVTEEATSDAPEATSDNTPAAPEKTEDVAEQATSEDAQATEEGASDEFVKKLADFDVDTEKYNSIKSFAADVSDVIKEDPKNQKGDTLKAFILDAKKKFADS